LALAHNALGIIPEWVGDFKELTTLDLTSTKASNFPKSIYNLKKLEILRIESSEDHLLQKIGEMENLHDLWLQMPLLKAIPDEIFRLEKLEMLGLEDCRMSELPDCLSEMRNLISFSLVNNHLDRLSR
jgi:Leucine-rich repeat (LRR) protein